MKPWKTAARRAALLAAAVAITGLGPTVHGQVRVERAPRALDMLAGRGGSEIGVSVRDLEVDGAKGVNGPALAGVLITDVTTGSPAEKAGIKKGDVVVEFDGERVRSVRQFTRLVQETPQGRQVSAGVTRDGKRTTVTVEPRESSALRLLGDMDGVRALGGFDHDFFEGFPVPPVPPAAPAPPAGPGMPPLPPPAPMPDIQSFFYRSGTGLGITVTSLSDQLADYFGAKRGVLVTAVQEGSAAQKAGFKAGDVVIALNGTDVSEPSELSRATQRLRDGDDFTADLVRDKKSMTLKGKAERRNTRSATRVSI
jgi:serine protease Do